MDCPPQGKRDPTQKKRVETMYGKSLGRSTSIRTEAATAIASHQNNGFEMIRGNSEGHIR